MNYADGRIVETVDFDYDAIDNPSGDEIQEKLDDDFWRLQGELFGDILRWLTVPKTLEGIGQRALGLTLYINPALIPQTSLAQIERLDGAPVGSAAISKALLLFQRKHNLPPGYFQKAEYLTDVYRRSAMVVSDSSRKTQLAAILRTFYSTGRTYSDTPTKHYRKMIVSSSPVSGRLIDLCKNEQSFGHLLTELASATEQGKGILGVSVVKRRSNGSRIVEITIR